MQDPRYRLLLKGIPQALTWQTNAEPLFRAADTVHHSLVMAALEHMDAPLAQRVNALPAGTQARFLFAPECFRLLFSGIVPPEEARPLLRSYLAREEWLNGGSSRVLRVAGQP